MGGGETPNMDIEEHLLIILPFKEPTHILERIRKNHPKIKITFFELKIEHVADAWISAFVVPDELYRETTILVTLSTLPKPAQAPNLKLIHFFSAGTNHVRNHPIYTETDIMLTTSSGIHGPQISEWVLLTALSHSHKFPKLLEWQREHKWGKFEDFSAVRDMVSQRLGVLGYGSIGRQVARVAKGMGMDVIAYTASPRPTPESRKDHGFIVPGTGDPDGTFPSAWYSGHTKKNLQEFLSQDIDILLISIPLTAETEHLLGEEEFTILGSKRNAFISNISRGQILDQDALIAALKKPMQEGGLRGAALDVTDPEPLPKESELWGMENVCVTPHISGMSNMYNTRAFQVLEVNLDRLKEGRGLVNVVDREKGY